MNNKKGPGLTKEWSQKLQIICQKAHQNQLNLQSFYRMNKLKFPPLLQSKHIIFNNLNNSKLQEQISQVEKNQIQQEGNNNMTHVNQGQYTFKSRPSICPIIFKHIKGRKFSVVHSNNIKFRNSKTIDIDKSISKTISKNMDKSSLKFLNEEYTPKNSLSTLFNLFYTSRSNLDYNRLGDSKNSKDLSPSENVKQELNQSILVNNAVTVNPERIFLQSLNRSRTHLLAVQRELIVKRNSRLDTKRISIYKNENGILHEKKKTVQKTKQLGQFQPWSMTNPEDEIQEIELPQVKSCKI